MFKKPQVLLVPGRVQRRLERNARKEYHRSRRTYTRSTAMVVCLCALPMLEPSCIDGDVLYKHIAAEHHSLTLHPPQTARPPNPLRLRRRPPLRLPRRRQALHRPHVCCPFIPSLQHIPSRNTHIPPSPPNSSTFRPTSSSSASQTTQN